MILNIIVLITGSLIYTHIDTRARALLIRSIANAELHDRRGLKARSASYDETTKFVFWKEASWSQATINYRTFKRRYFSPCCT